jgi:hypothetical protein
MTIVEMKGMPELDWEKTLPEDLAPYIEAQIWNHSLLTDFK